VLTWLARLIIGWYPSAWRERYEAEVLDLLEAARVRLRDLKELVQGLVLERWRQLASSPESPRRTAVVLVLFGPVIVLAVVLAATGVGHMLRDAFGAWPETWVDAGEWVMFVVLFGLIPFEWRSKSRRRADQRGVVVGATLAALFVLVAGNAWGDLVRFDGSWRQISWTLADIVVLKLFWVAGIGLTHGLWPDKTIIDAIDRREMAQQQLDMSRAWVEGCHTSAANGLPVPLEEAEAQVARWEAEFRDARAALEAMGYRARFQS
jgi:hypothetical protein